MSAVADAPPSTAVPPARMPAPPSNAPPAPAAAPSKTAKQSMREALESRATPVAEPPPNEWERPPIEQPARPGAQKPENEESTEENPPARSEETTEQTPPVVDPKKAAKPNNWKVLNESLKTERTKNAELQAQITKLAGERVPDQERSTITERLTKAEARAKELEDHIRFVDYQKSEEFQSKYEAPYIEAWKGAMQELSEIPVNDPAVDGGVRAATQEDVWALVNMPLGQAHEAAKELFGEFANVALGHRKDIKNLLAQRNKAVEEAKTNGSTRIKQAQEAHQAALQKTAQDIGKQWQEITNSILSDPAMSEFLKPIEIPEGKQPTPEEKEWNDFLDKGKSLVDKYWKMSPLDNKLTPEQRREVIAGHAAIRHRAAAFGPLKRMAKRLQKRVKELEKQLGGYQESTPSTTGGGGSQRPTSAKGAKAEFHNALVKKMAR